MPAIIALDSSISEAALAFSFGSVWISFPIVTWRHRNQWSALVLLWNLIRVHWCESERISLPSDINFLEKNVLFWLYCCVTWKRNDAIERCWIFTCKIVRACNKLRNSNTRNQIIEYRFRIWLRDVLHLFNTQYMEIYTLIKYYVVVTGIQWSGEVD
jgi:hypothetical protein